MSLLGNDVVDLDDPAIARSHLRPRLVGRICGDAELARFGGALDPKVLLWSLFAAKEAAYKLVCKPGPPPLFAHRRFRVSNDHHSVEHEGRTFGLRVVVASGWVHAVAFTANTPPAFGVEAVAPGVAPGTAARQALLSHLLRRRPRWDRLEIVREVVPGSWDGQGPPRLVRAGRPLKLDISLSHDGRFAAYAVAGAR